MARQSDGTFRAVDKIQQAKGRIGGLTTGDSKRRLGASNGRYSEGRERHPCCGAIKGRSHKKTCENHRNNKIARALRKDNIPVKVNTDNFDFTPYISSSPVIMMIRGTQGICQICNTTINSVQSKKVHKADLNEPTMRVICASCL